MFLIQTHHFTPGHAFLCVNCWNQTVGVAGLGWVLKFKAVKEHQQAQVLDLQQRRSPYSAGEFLNGISNEVDFYICHPKIREGTSAVAVTPVSPECPGCCVGEGGSPFHMTTLLIADCGGENLVFQLQLPVPVLKSAFVLPAYCQGNQGHLEMFLQSKRPDFSHLGRKGFIFQ